MTIAAVLRRLDDLGVSLRIRGQSIILAGPVETVPPDMLRDLATIKPDLLHLTGGDPGYGPQVERTVYLASSGQRRLSYIAQLDPRVPGYNVTAAIRFSGPLDLGKLRSALIATAEAQPAIRTRLAIVDDEELAVVGASRSLELPVYDLRVLAPSQRAKEIEAIHRSIARHCFELDQDPLLRWALVHTCENECELVASLHHFICDGWSLVRTLRNGAAVYSGQQAAPGRQPIVGAGSFGEHARRQREHLREPAMVAARAAWKDRVADFLTPLDLPLPFHPAPREARGARVEFALGTDLELELRKVARALKSTISAVLATVYALTLGTISNAERFLIGIAASDRPAEDFDATVGFFVNWLPLRIDLRGQASFAERVAQIHRERLDAFADVQIPFEEIVAASGVEPSADRHPLFQFLLVSHVPARRARFGDLDVSVKPLFAGAVKLDFTLFITDTARAIPVVGSDGDLFLEIEYAADRIGEETVDEFVGSFIATARSLVEDPEAIARSSRLPVESTVHGETRPYPASVLIAIDDVVSSRGDGVALSFLGDEWSYAKLADEAAAVAACLTSAGVVKGDRVCTLQSRGFDAIATMLGIMLAGGIYVPLDLCMPDFRLSAMIDAAEPAAFFVSPPLTNRVRGLARDARILELGQANPDARWEPYLARIEEVDPAYLLFTSGSTGQPKGVLGGHGQLANFCAWLADYLTLGSGDSVIAKTSQTFDASYRETLAALAVGARIELVDDTAATDTVTLLRRLCKARILVLHATPTLYRDLLLVIEQGRREGLAEIADLCLRAVMCGGEMLPPDLAETHFRLLPACRLYNVYGPTECTVDVLAHEVVAASRAKVPIGRPIWNTSIALIDENARPVAAGREGMIAVAGVPVALGYWPNRESGAKFVTGAAAGLPDQARCFLTGDYGVLCSDGAIEFRGRKDRQVQLNGLRTELDDIEASLLRVVEIAQVAVVLHLRCGHPSLEAYVELHEGSSRQSGGYWRESARAFLPEATIPYVFHVLPRLPRLINGKIDREALAGIALPQQTIPPVSAEAARLLGIMQDLLGRCDVEPAVSFFAQGGHSLSAVRLVARANREFGRAATVRDFFIAPTAIEFADLLVRSGASEPSAPIGRVNRPRRIDNA